MAKKKRKTPQQVVAEESRDFQAQQDLRTLQSAEDIRSDASRLGAAQSMADEQMQALKKAKKVKPIKKK